MLIHFDLLYTNYISFKFSLCFKLVSPFKFFVSTNAIPFLFEEYIKIKLFGKYLSFSTLFTSPRLKFFYTYSTNLLFCKR